MDIEITQNSKVLFTIPEHELVWAFSTSSGPGGQHANKVATRVQLTWEFLTSESLPSQIRDALSKKLGDRATVRVDEARSQYRNRQIAIERLAAQIEGALHRPKVRRSTKPTRGSQRRRVESKRQRSETKRLRERPRSWD